MDGGDSLDERAAILRSVLDAPEDDAPRLIYSDWLEKNGEDERAQTIRGHVARVLGPFDAPMSKAMTFAFSPEINFYVRSGDSGSVVIAPAIPGVQWVCSRGFVSEIRLTCELFVMPGKACKACNGFGVVPHIRKPISAGGQGATFYECKVCNGKGKLPSLTERIFSEHPVTRVVLTDKRAMCMSMQRWRMNTHHAFSWMTESQATTTISSHVLPDFIFNLLRPTARGLAFAFYNDLEIASDDLSSACVAHGRSLVGLPALTNI